MDPSVLFAAVLSPAGGSRMILKLGEVGALDLWVGPRVLQEAEGVVARKAPGSRALLALLLDRARVSVGEPPASLALRDAEAVVDYAPDARSLAEAIMADTDYLVTLDREHFVGNARVANLPFPVGTPGDLIEWLRERVIGGG